MARAIPSPTRPDFKLIYKGVDITADLLPHLISCTYTDHVHGKADEIEVSVQDKDGLWIGPWCPEHGDAIELLIAGDKATGYVPCGTFEIDEPEPDLGRKGDTFSFRGVAAPVTKALRTTKTEPFENQSLADIARKIAGKHGLTLLGTPPMVMFERITQRRKRDLEFLKGLAEDYGAYFSVRGAKLVMMQRSEAHSRPPTRVIAKESADYITAKLKKTAHKTYSKAKASYFDGNAKKTIKVEVEDQDVKTGDTLKIDDRVENEGQARQRAKADLERENMKQKTGTVLVPGDPLLCAGQMIELDAGFGKWAGRYVIQTSRHHIVRKAYTTSLEIAAVKDGGSSGSAGAGSGGTSGARNSASASTGSNGRLGFASPAQRA